MADKPKAVPKKQIRITQKERAKKIRIIRKKQGRLAQRLEHWVYTPGTRVQLLHCLRE